MDDKPLFFLKTAEKPKTCHAVIAMLSDKDLAEKFGDLRRRNHGASLAYSGHLVLRVF